VATQNPDRDEGKVSTSEVLSLQGQIRDLAALLALPGMWRGREVPFIAGSLLDALISLLRVDLAYLRLEGSPADAVIEECRPKLPMSAPALRAALENWKPTEEESAAALHDVPGYGPMRAVRLHPRPARWRPVVIVCSARASFPTQVESFLLRTAVDLGMSALESSQLLHDVQEANQAKSAFLATMSHELRTPLNAILGYVDLLDAEVSGSLNERQKLSLSRVRAGTRHLMELIEGILSFARVEAGQEHVHRARFELGSLVRDSAALVEPLARAKNLSYVVNTPALPVNAETDAAKVRQILLNLLSNAVKFTNTGGIVLDLNAENDSAVIAVRDTGIGIPFGELERIFEPFRQVGDVYTEKNKGTGLGLSVSRQLARMLGGDVTVASSIDEGSVFQVRLPLSAPAATPSS
jgi:signal transduction histidine kinase